MHDLLVTLLDHLVWADARTRDALRALPGDAPGAGEARTLYAHLAAAEHVWLARLQGRTPTHPVWPALALDAAAALAAESAAGLRAHVAALAPTALDGAIHYRTSAGQAFASTVRDVIVHVALHGSHHRGQIARLVRAGGGAPAATDYILWARGGDVLPPSGPATPPAAG